MMFWKISIRTVVFICLLSFLINISGCSSLVIKTVNVVDSMQPEQATTQPPIVANNTVYYGSDKGFLYAINAANGKIKWKQKIPERDKSATADLPENIGENFGAGPVISEGIIYAANNYETFFAFDTSKRKYLWKKQVASTSGLLPTIKVHNKTLYLDDFGGITALSAKTGESWSIAVREYTVGESLERLSPPIIENGIIYCAGESGNIYAFSEEKGCKIWETDAKKFGLENEEYIVFNEPAKLGNILYFTTNTPNVYAINADDGSLIWKFKGSRDMSSAPTVGNNTVFVSLQEAECVYAFDAKTGKIKWQFKTGPEGADTRPLIQGNTLYIGGWDRKIHALNTETGEEIWSYDVKDQIGDNMAIDSKAIYFRTHYAGSIKAVSLETHKEIWSTEK